MKLEQQHADALLLGGASLLGGIGTLLPSLWFLAPVGLAFLLYLVWFRVDSTWKAAFSGFVFGLIQGGAGVWWLWHMVPLPLPSEVGIPAHYALAGLVWFVTAVLSGFASALVTALLYVLRSNTFIALIAGGAWVLGEELRMWLFALYSWGPGSLLGPHFSQTAIGYALAEQAYLLQLAEFGGVRFLTFACVVLAAFFALIVKGREAYVRAAVAAFLCALLLLLPSVGKTTSPLTEPLSLAVMPAGEASLTDAIAYEPDIVVFPESTRSLPEEGATRSAFPDHEVLVLGTRHVPVGTGSASYAELVYESSSSGTLGVYRKMFLMPQGEYYPIAAKFLYALAGSERAYAEAPNVGNRLIAGDSLVAVPFKGTVIGGLVCSDILSPSLYKELSQIEGARVLVNVSNPEWFHGSRAFHDKTLQIARVHAVEARSYFVMASASSPSFVLNPRGAIVATTGWGDRNVLRVVLAP